VGIRQSTNHEPLTPVTLVASRSNSIGLQGLKRFSFKFMIIVAEAAAHKIHLLTNL